MRICTLRIITTICACFACLPHLATKFYYRERLAIKSLLSRYDEIEDVEIVAFDDTIGEEVVNTSFSIRGRPNSFLSIRGLENHWNGRLAHLRLEHIGNVSADADIGPDREGEDGLPFTIDNLDDLIRSYDEVTEFFATHYYHYDSQRWTRKLSPLDGIANRHQQESSSTRPR